MESHNCGVAFVETFELVADEDNFHFVVLTCPACGTKEYRRTEGTMPSEEP